MGLILGLNIFDILISSAKVTKRLRQTNKIRSTIQRRMSDYVRTTIMLNNVNDSAADVYETSTIPPAGARVAFELTL